VRCDLEQHQMMSAHGPAFPPSLSPSRVALLAAREAAVAAELMAMQPWEAYCESRKRHKPPPHTQATAQAAPAPTSSAGLGHMGGLGHAGGMQSEEMLAPPSECSIHPALPQPTLDLTSPQPEPPSQLELPEHRQHSVLWTHPPACLRPSNPQLFEFPEAPSSSSVPCAHPPVWHPTDRATEQLSVGHHRHSSASWLYGDDSDADPIRASPPKRFASTSCLDLTLSYDAPVRERTDASSAGGAEFPLLALFHAQ
jgi:hypothetical protein